METVPLVGTLQEVFLHGAAESLLVELWRYNGRQAWAKTFFDYVLEFLVPSESPYVINNADNEFIVGFIDAKQQRVVHDMVVSQEGGVALYGRPQYRSWVGLKVERWFPVQSQ